jgi:glutamate dehydrogenase
MPEQLRLSLFERTARGLRGHIADVLRSCHGTLEPNELIEDLCGGVGRLSHTTAELLRGEAQVQAKAMAQELADAGTPADVVQRVVHLFDLDGAIGLAHLADELDVDAVVLTGAFADLGAQLGIDWAQQTAARMVPSDPWERLLVAGLARDFQQMRMEFLRRLGGTNPDDATHEWLAAKAEPVRQLRALIARAQATATVTPAMLAQIASQARSLLLR